VGEPPQEARKFALDRRRYLRLVIFGARAVITIVWWELILRRLLGGDFVGRSAPARYGKIGRQLRTLAVGMGGVLIKLGQFLSTRVDLLPRYFTGELAGLQDEVPAEPFENVRQVIESEFSRPLAEVFPQFERQSRAAASLAQVHRATLPDGRLVVVKVQRLNIEQLVDTDLAALRTVVSWLRYYRPISRCADLNALIGEFSRTLYEELDFIAEGHNAEQFAENFAADPGVYIPEVYWSHTTRRVLILEDVGYIKINDYAALQAAGIDRRQVASRLFNSYLKQLIVDHFVHADPHPGNLFVQPLMDEPLDPETGRPFVLVFVDFGMVAHIPQRLWELALDFAVAVVRKDIHRIVEIYEEAGVLLPGADKELIEKLEREAIERWQGTRIGEMRKLAMEYTQLVFNEYRELIYQMPFQFPSDLLFAGRAMAIMGGMVTDINPDFEIWEEMTPYVEELATERAAEEMPMLWERLKDYLLLLLNLPTQAERFFDKALAGELRTQMVLPRETQDTLRQLERAVNKLGSGVIFTGLLLGGVLLRMSEGPGLASNFCFVGAALALLWVIWPWRP
jgi:predicted unusual protein kinase regulating ubiquinone biosynthesis (AarF/ABC1/UbiB family)